MVLYKISYWIDKYFVPSKLFFQFRLSDRYDVFRIIILCRSVNIDFHYLFEICDVIYLKFKYKIEKK